MKVDIQFSEPRVHCPDECSEAKGVGKLSIYLCADGDTVGAVCRTIISVNQFSIYGGVSDLCEECKICHVRTGRLVVVGQSDPLFVSSMMKTRILSTDDFVQEDLFQKYQERMEGSHNKIV